MHAFPFGHRFASRRLIVPFLLAFLLFWSGCGNGAQDTAQTADEAAEPDLRSSAEGAVSYIISPLDGETVESPFLVQFGLSGMGVAPAGVRVANTGHHHLMIDVDELPPLDQPMPSDEHHRHFGGGQTETVLDLPPGTHTLQLVLGNYAHTPHDPPVVSEKITIEVAE